MNKNGLYFSCFVYIPPWQTNYMPWNTVNNSLEIKHLGSQDPLRVFVSPDLSRELHPVKQTNKHTHKDINRQTDKELSKSNAWFGEEEEHSLWPYCNLSTTPKKTHKKKHNQTNKQNKTKFIYYTLKPK